MGVVQKLRHPQGSHSQGPPLPSAGDVDISVTAGIWPGGVPLSNAAQPLAAITVVLVHDEAKQATVDGGHLRLEDGDVHLLAAQALVLSAVPCEHGCHSSVVPRLVLNVVAAQLQRVQVRQAG